MISIGSTPSTVQTARVRAALVSAQHAARRRDVFSAAITMAESTDDAPSRDADAMADFVPTSTARPDDGPKLRCCCGRNDCAFLKHSCTLLETVEKDVHTAAKLGKVRCLCPIPSPFFFLPRPTQSQEHSSLCSSPVRPVSYLDAFQDLISCDSYQEDGALCSFQSANFALQLRA